MKEVIADERFDVVEEVVSDGVEEVLMVWMYLQANEWEHKKL